MSFPTKFQVSLGQVLSIGALIVSLSVAWGTFINERQVIKEGQTELARELKDTREEIILLRETIARIGQKLDNHLEVTVE